MLEAAIVTELPPPTPPPPPEMASNVAHLVEQGSGQYVLENASGQDVHQASGQTITWVAPPDRQLYFDFTGTPLTGGPQTAVLAAGQSLQRVLGDVPPGCFAYQAWSRPAGTNAPWVAVSGVSACPGSGDPPPRIDIRPKVIIE